MDNTITINHPDGRVLTINSPDGSMPSEQQIDQMFGQANQQFLPNQNKVENLISNRGSQFQPLVDIAKQLQAHPINSLLNPANPIGANLNTVPKAVGQAAFGSLEAPIANAGLAVQRGEPQKAIPEAVQGLLGNKQGQVGDIIRTTGFGGKLNEPIAKATGLLAMSAGIPEKEATVNPVVKSAINDIEKNVFNPVAKTTQEFRNFKAVKASAEDVAKQIQQSKDIQASTNELGKNIALDISQKQGVLRQQYVESSKIRDINNTNARQVLVDNLVNMKKQLTEAAQNGAIRFQEMLPKFFRANSDAYGERLDTIANDMVAKGKPLLQSDASQVVQKTLDDLDQMGVQDGGPRKAIESLNKKYALSYIDSQGNHIVRDPNTPLDFKEFNSDIRNIRKALSAQAKSGQKFSVEDIANSVLHSNYGDYIANNVPEFKNLQEAYRPTIEAMKEAGKQFKPYTNLNSSNINIRGGVQNIQGTNLLKRLGTGNATPQEQNLVTMLEEGSQFSPGVGNISQPAQEAGEGVNKLTQMIKEQQLAHTQESQRLGLEHQQNIGQLEQGKTDLKNIIANQNVKSNLERMPLENKNAELIKQIETTKSKAKALLAALVGGVAIAGGSYGIKKGIQSILPNKT